MVRRISRSATIFVGAVAALLGIAGIVWSERERELTTHLTIYVDPAIAREGGLVIVSAIPIPHDEWEKLPDTNDAAMWDVTNGKHQQVGLGDKHFGAIVSSKMAAVEIFYPEDGTYTFNFLKFPNDAVSPALRTERTSIGSGSLIPDPATGKSMEWPSESVVSISGSDGSANWAADLEDEFFYLTGPFSYKYYRTTSYVGGRVIEITNEGLKELRDKNSHE